MRKLMTSMGVNGDMMRLCPLLKVLEVLDVQKVLEVPEVLESPTGNRATGQPRLPSQETPPGLILRGRLVTTMARGMSTLPAQVREAAAHYYLDSEAPRGKTASLTTSSAATCINGSSWRARLHRGSLTGRRWIYSSILTTSSGSKSSGVTPSPMPLTMTAVSSDCLMKYSALIRSKNFWPIATSLKCTRRCFAWVVNLSFLWIRPWIAVKIRFKKHNPA